MPSGWPATGSTLLEPCLAIGTTRGLPQHGPGLIEPGPTIIRPCLMHAQAVLLVLLSIETY
jgi:hypothetical protein